MSWTDRGRFYTKKWRKKRKIETENKREKREYHLVSVRWGGISDSGVHRDGSELPVTSRQRDDANRVLSFLLVPLT